MKIQFRIRSLIVIGLFTVGICMTLGSIISNCDSVDLETTRDDKGVWYVTGPKNAAIFDVFEAVGYAVAQDRLLQTELFRRAARGTLAELQGPEFIETDMVARTFGYTEDELTSEYNSLGLEERDMIAGSAAGINRRLVEIRADNSLLPYEFVLLGQIIGSTFVPDNWSPQDILALASYFLRDYDVEGAPGTEGQLDNAVLLQELREKFPADFSTMFDDLNWINDPQALSVIPSSESNFFLQSDAYKFKELKLPDMHSPAATIKSLHKRVVEKLKSINAHVKMGSYAWTVAGSKTESGNPIIYSGPQMGFMAPAVIGEGSIKAGGLNVSGMQIAGLPPIIIGRTPHHAWSMQVGHAHTVDYYIEDPANVSLHRIETIKVLGAAAVQFPVYRSTHGPIAYPFPFDPATTEPIVSWKYAHWGKDFNTVGAYLDLARAQSMDEFGAAIEKIAVSQHYCYADVDGNIAYWMSGFDPIRAPGADPRLPQLGDGSQEWPEPVQNKPRSHSRNTMQGFYGGWNNKSNPNYDNAPNNEAYSYGPFHRAHVVAEYLESRDNLTFEQIRDLAINIATTDSFGLGGNPWVFVADVFADAVRANPTPQRLDALALMESWDGHFVAGGATNWAAGTDRADAWMLMDAWIRNVLRLVFDDELLTRTMTYEDQNTTMLFNTLLHGFNGLQADMDLLSKPGKKQNFDRGGIVNRYNWFRNLEDPDAPQTAEQIIVAALDTALDNLGDRPWGSGQREEIVYDHLVLGPVHSMPFSSRSTYAHVVEMGSSGPVRIESMFPLGQSGDIRMGSDGQPVYDPNFFSMTPVFDHFMYRPFSLDQYR